MKLRAKSAPTPTSSLASPATAQKNHNADPSATQRLVGENLVQIAVVAPSPPWETCTHARAVLAPAPSNPLNVSPAVVTSPLLRDGSSHLWCGDHLPLIAKTTERLTSRPPDNLGRHTRAPEASALEGPVSAKNTVLNIGIRLVRACSARLSSEMLALLMTSALIYQTSLQYDAA